MSGHCRWWENSVRCCLVLMQAEVLHRKKSRQVGVLETLVGALWFREPGHTLPDVTAS